jgi:hypothetical protein
MACTQAPAWSRAPIGRHMGVRERKLTRDQPKHEARIQSIGSCTGPIDNPETFSDNKQFLGYTDWLFLIYDYCLALYLYVISIEYHVYLGKNPV